jgi:hypothetical protein
VAGDPAAGNASVGPGASTTAHPAGNVLGQHSAIPTKAADAFGATATPVGGSASGSEHAGNEKRAADEGANDRSSSSAAAGWMTARRDAAARDLLAGNFVGAYGLQNPASNPAGDLTAARSSALTDRPARAADMPQGQSEDRAVQPQPSLIDTMSHGTRGPEGGAQSSAGGGGAAGPLMLVISFARFPAPCVKFVPQPTMHPMCAEAHRLERPG